MNRKRLPIEPLRNAILAASGDNDGLDELARFTARTAFDDLD